MPQGFTPPDPIERLTEALISRAKFTADDISTLLEKASFKQYDKNELILREGETEQYVSFVMEGMARLFFFRGEKEHSIDFFFRGSFLSSYESFITQTPSVFSIQALSPLSLLRINHTEIQLLFEKNAKLQQIGRILTEELFMRLSERVQDLLSLSATERYNKLLDLQPEYVLNIPLKYLASYLNVTPESLSRIRKG